MLEIFCNSCFNTSISFDGVVCLFCGSCETSRVTPSNIHLPVPKPDNATTENFIPDSYACRWDTSTATVQGGSMRLEQANIPAKTIDSTYVQSDQCHVQEKSIRKECLPVDQTYNTFKPDISTDLNFEPVNPSESGYQLQTKVPSWIIVDNTNANQPILLQDTESSKIRSVSNADDFLAAPGPSGLQKKMKMSESCEEKLQRRKSLETNSAASGDKKVCACRVCNEDIYKHPHDGDNYKCCLCPYQTSDPGNLQKHSYGHRPANICDICEREYVGDLHNNKRKCVVCPELFMCRTQLREHYLDHREYFRTHCWNCYMEIRKHDYGSDKKKTYVCCFCGFRTSKRKHFLEHNTTHAPKILCKICEEEYYVEDIEYHGKEFPCFWCEKIFQCRTQLEEHFADHAYNRSTRCCICKSELAKHKCELEVKTAYECCKCFEIIKGYGYKNLISHLLAHDNLRFFKCDWCRKRFPTKNSLTYHSRKCRIIAYRCEICGDGFTNKDSLNMHRSKIHN